MVQFRHVIVQLALAIDKQRCLDMNINLGSLVTFVQLKFFFQNFHIVQVLQVLQAM